MKATTVLAAALLLSACRNYEDTPLKQAAGAGDAARVRALLAAGTPADEPSHLGFTPLMIASRGGRVEVMQLLLSAGADVNNRDDVVNEWTPLVHAIHKGQNPAARLLLEAGANPDLPMGGGATALMFAAAYGNAEMVRELLAHGANPRAEAEGGKVTALSNALGGGAMFDLTDGPSLGTCHTETVRILVAAAPDLQIPPAFTSSLARRFARSQTCREAYALVQGKPRATN